MHRLALVLLLAAGCRSSAPYTVPSAAINGALALGASAIQRSSGGCYAVCTHGTVCNPATGYCERGAELRCTGEDIGSALCPQTKPGMSASQAAPTGSPYGLAPTVGVSPATGAAPPPPAEASPPGP